MCVGAISIDLKEAFDAVTHKILICELAHFNLSSNALDWMKSCE